MYEFLGDFCGGQVFELGEELVFFWFVLVLWSTAGEQTLGIGGANDVLNGFEIDARHESGWRPKLSWLLLRHAV